MATLPNSAADDSYASRRPGRKLQALANIAVGIVEVAFTDCLIHPVESVDRELLLTVLKPGVSDSYRATLTADESTSLIDKSDESWHTSTTNQLQELSHRT